MSELNFYAYETYCMVRIDEMKDDREDDRRLLAGCRDLALKVERTLNMYDEESELSILCRNYSVNQPYEISELLYHFLEINLKMAKICEGAFDPVIGALVKRWGIVAGNAAIPEKSEIQRLIAQTGYRHVRLIPGRYEVVIDIEGIIIDPGASGKGFAIDIIINYLRKKCVRRACLDFGGNLYVMGNYRSNPWRESSCSFDGSQNESKLWRIGIRHPDTPEKMMAVVHVRDRAVSTSSWYEHYFEKNGRIYSHLLDPATGEPAKSGLISVTVVCGCAVYADILSTALYVLGESRGKQVIRRLREELDLSVDYAFMRSDRSLTADGHCFSPLPCTIAT